MGALTTQLADDGAGSPIAGGLRMFDESAAANGTGPHAAASLGLALVAASAPDYTAVAGALRGLSMTTAGELRVLSTGGAVESGGNLDSIDGAVTQFAGAMGTVVSPAAGTLLALSTLIESHLDEINTRDAASAASTAPVPVAGSIAHDAAATTQAPMLGGGYASLALPSAVSADGDAVRAAYTRQGAAYVSPAMTDGGHISATSSATGANWTAFGSQTCKQLTVFNNTGTVIEVRQDAAGVAVPIQDDSWFTFYGIANADELGIRRVDQSNTQVTVQARWES